MQQPGTCTAIGFFLCKFLSRTTRSFNFHVSRVSFSVFIRFLNWGLCVCCPVFFSIVLAHIFHSTDFSWIYYNWNNFNLALAFLLLSSRFPVRLFLFIYKYAHQWLSKSHDIFFPQVLSKISLCFQLILFFFLFSLNYTSCFAHANPSHCIIFIDYSLFHFFSMFVNFFVKYSRGNLITFWVFRYICLVLVFLDIVRHLMCWS